MTTNIRNAKRAVLLFGQTPPAAGPVVVQGQLQTDGKTLVAD
jgi:hypothetical protein